MLLTNQRLFWIRKLSWMEFPLFTWDPDSFAWFCICKEFHMSISMGLTPRKQGPWVLKFSRPTCNGRRWSKAELTGSGSFVSLLRISESVPGGTWNISQEFSLYIYIYIYIYVVYICVCGNKQACQLVFRISQVGGMLWLQHFGAISGSLKMFLHAQSLKI